MDVDPHPGITGEGHHVFQRSLSDLPRPGDLCHWWCCSKPEHRPKPVYCRNLRPLRTQPTRNRGGAGKFTLAPSQALILSEYRHIQRRSFYDHNRKRDVFFALGEEFNVPGIFVGGTLQVTVRVE